ncbi:ABC transporter permease [Micromonospora wenchangensis]|uniref:ABC transporter permease n=1 Tax=Micromonospora wenchangensis TaxID=1185415 RepID=UPI003D75201D
MTITTERTAEDTRAGDPPRRTFGNRLRRFYKSHSTVLHTITTLVLGCVLWQVIAANTSALVIVPLGDIGAAFRTSAQNGELWLDFRESLSGFAQGFLLAALVGILIGVLMAINKVTFDFLDPWMSALYSTPLIALAPLYILVFGIGMTARVAVVFTLAVFPIVLNTTAGIRTTDPNLIETARAFGASRMQRFTKILLPWSVPFVVTGLRLAVGRGLMGVVVAEFFGSTSGLGHRVFISSQNFDTAAVWMGVFVLAAIGVVFIRAMYVLETRIAPWRQNGKNGGKIL